jgi:hypothetical protein
MSAWEGSEMQAHVRAELARHPPRKGVEQTPITEDVLRQKLLDLAGRMVDNLPAFGVDKERAEAINAIVGAYYILKPQPIYGASALSSSASTP